MADSRSDDELRRIVFGRGSTDAEVSAASEELARRATPSTLPAIARESPSTHASDSHVRTEDGELFDRDGASGEDDAPASPRNAKTRTFVIAAAVGVVALAGGWAAGTHVSTSGASAAPTTTPEPGLGSRALVIDPDTGATVYEVPAGRPDYLSQSSSSRLPEAVEVDPDDSRLPAIFDNVDTATARYVGRIGDLEGAWTARNSSGEYCVVIALNDSGSFAWSCSSVGVFAERGVMVGSGRYSLLWNPGSAILSMTAD